MLGVSSGISWCPPATLGDVPATSGQGGSSWRLVQDRAPRCPVPSLAPAAPGAATAGHSARPSTPPAPLWEGLPFPGPPALPPPPRLPCEPSCPRSCPPAGRAASPSVSGTPSQAEHTVSASPLCRRRALHLQKNSPELLGTYCGLAHFIPARWMRRMQLQSYLRCKRGGSGG